MMNRNGVLLAVFFGPLVFVGMLVPSRTVAFPILEFRVLISAIMALGVNIQWGHAGLFSAGTTGFVASGRRCSRCHVNAATCKRAWTNRRVEAYEPLSPLHGANHCYISFCYGNVWPTWTDDAVPLLPERLIIGFFIFRYLFDPAVAEIESVNAASC